MPRFPHVDLEEATDHVRDPRAAATTFPFEAVEQSSQPPPPAGGKAAEDLTAKGTGGRAGEAAARAATTESTGTTSGAGAAAQKSTDPGTAPTHKQSAMKYGSGRVPEGVQQLARRHPALCKSMRSKKWLKRFFKTGSNSVTLGTWRSYKSAWRQYKTFSKERGITRQWPLRGETLNSFVLWCASKQNLAPATIKAYVTGLKTLGVILGGNRAIKGWDLTKFLLRGLANRGTRHRQAMQGSDPCCFDILKELKIQLDRKHWSGGSAQCFWACCCVGYFGASGGGGGNVA